jgi:hypothetical protein
MDDELLINLLSKQYGLELSVQETPNRLMQIINQARDGKASLVGSEQEGQVVIISLRDLIELMTNVMGEDS